MSYFSSILNFPISTTDLIPLTAIRTPTSVLSLPNEIILHILQYLHVGESVLFGLTCRRLYALHRRLNSSLISLSTICPNPLACQCLPTEELYFYGQRGFQSMFLPHQQHEVGAVASLDEYGVIRFTDRERAKSPEELELIRRRTELGCYEIPCFTLAEKLKGWMGKGWEFCFACGRFRRVRKWRVDWGFQYRIWFGTVRKWELPKWLKKEPGILVDPSPKRSNLEPAACKICNVRKPASVPS